MADCEKRTVTKFPWSTEDMQKAYRMVHPDIGADLGRAELCALWNPELQEVLMRRVKRRNAAVKEMQEERKAAHPEKEAKKKKERQGESAAPLKHTEEMKFPDTIEAMLEDRDLVPFTSDVVVEAQPNEPGFWSRLYRKNAARMLSRLKTMTSVNDIASNAAPTAEFPWSDAQLLLDDDSKRPRRTTAVHEFSQQGSYDYRHQVQEQAPMLDFNLVDALLTPEYKHLLPIVARHRYTPFIPWRTEYILHYLRALLPERDTANLSMADPTGVRMTLLLHWRDEFVADYVSNLTPVPIKFWAIPKFAPFGSMVLAYATWNVKGKEFAEQRLQKIWAADILIRTYELLRSSRADFSGRYADYVTAVASGETPMELCSTNTGVFLLNKDDFDQLRDQDMLAARFEGPRGGGFTKSAVREQARFILEASASAAQVTRKEDDVGADRPEEHDISVSDRALRREVAASFALLYEYVLGVEAFLFTAYMKNRDFRGHTGVFLGNLASLRVLYVNSKQYDGKSKVTMKTVRDWAVEHEPPAAVRVFEQDMQTAVYPNVPPLLADTLRFQSYVRKTWPELELPAVEAEPQKPTCGADEDEGAVRPEKSFIAPDNAQLFMNAEFNPGSFENGRIVVHSVGSGKTCLAIRIASDFSRAGFRILWVTKTTLRNQVLKNHVTEICNLLIRDHWEGIYYAAGGGDAGKAAANEWLNAKVPRETSFQSVLQTLKKVFHMDWTNLSYRQLSNALQQKNNQGRAWFKEAAQAAFEPAKVDPLRKTLVIIDEAHKMFTGELDRTELPNVPVIHDALQHSYAQSGPLRCRTLFLTATPTTDSVLPMIAMLNMLHNTDVFPYRMRTIDPTVTTDEGLLQHIKDIRAENEATEQRIACDMFPRGLSFCDPEDQRKHQEKRLKRMTDKERRKAERQQQRAEKVDENDEDGPGEDEEANAYFDTRALMRGGSLRPEEITERLQEFWQKAFGLISYYNISADYSKFPHTRFKPIIVPSATDFQEVQMASELAATKKDLPTTVRRIRQIAAWAKFEPVDTAEHRSRKPNRRDEAIIKENAENTYFEPTIEDLEKRLGLLRGMIEQEQRNEPDPEDSTRLAELERRRSELLNVYNRERKIVEAYRAQMDALAQKETDTESALEADPESPALREAAEAAWKQHDDAKKEKKPTMADANRAQREVNEMLTPAIEALQAKVNGHNAARNQNIRTWEKRIERITKHIAQLEKQNRRRGKHNQTNIAEFLQAIDEEPNEANEQGDEDAEDEVLQKPRTRQRRPKVQQPQRRKKEDAADETDEDNASTDDEAIEDELRRGEEAEQKIPGEYYTVKRWEVDDKQPLPSERPKHPKKHYFDQPETFSAEDFRRDMPLYSPKVTKLIDVLRACDADDAEHNPEDRKADRHRKHLIFCEDIHDIRAVAGALMAHGWTFGMELANVAWTKEYFSTENNKMFAKWSQRSRNTVLTWLPTLPQERDRLGRPQPGPDYKRFLILTKSKIGGVAGATLNEYAVQLLGQKGSRATYNHRDNVRGRLHRVILIDRNFMEGIDLPSTYGHLYDSVLSKSSRTQIIGRISRFCGSKDLPFVPNEGWPQKVFRYDLKFHIVSLHIPDAQRKSLEELLSVPNGKFASVVPAGYGDAFMNKLDSNLFSPTELQIILSGDMEVQRVKRKTLDAYEALMERVSIGALLYHPAMRNLEVQRSELDDQLMEEEETENEYKEEVWLQDKKRSAPKAYNLRVRKELQQRWVAQDSHLLSTIIYEVHRTIRPKRGENVDLWANEDVRNRFFDGNIRWYLQNDPELMHISERAARTLTWEVIDARVADVRERNMSAEQTRVAKEEAKAEKAERGATKAIQATIRTLAGKGKRIRESGREELWESYHKLSNPSVTRGRFDAAFSKLLLQKKSSKSSTSSKAKSEKRERRSRQHKVVTAAIALEKTRAKNGGMLYGKLKSDEALQKQLITLTLLNFPDQREPDVRQALDEWLEQKRANYAK